VFEKLSTPASIYPIKSKNNQKYGFLRGVAGESLFSLKRTWQHSLG